VITRSAATSPHAWPPIAKRRGAYRVATNLDDYDRVRAGFTWAAEAIEAEVIDLRSLRPLDDATIIASVAKTRRAVIVDEGWRSGSLAAEICTRIVEQAFWELDAPIGRVCSEEVPIPYPRHLENAAIPQAPKIVAAAKAALARS
jgi:pyruvate/2-oxoglutarate/acetoin dehydrogenase E1 component